MGQGFGRTVLGRSGLEVSRIALGTGGGGLASADLERAFERGVNFFYWGSLRAGGFGDGIRAVTRKDRDRAVVMVQSYTRVASLMRPSFERALRKLQLAYADFLLLGMWNQPPPARILEAAIALRDQGKARFIAISCHDRLTFERYITDPTYGSIMVRYNAAHPGAETEVFPHVARAENPPGVIVYTATRWSALTNPANIPSGEKVPLGSDCYRFVLTQPNVNVCVSAPQNAEQLDDTLSTLDKGPLDAAEMEWMRRVGAAVRAKVNRKTSFNPVQLLDRISGAMTGSSKAYR